jgi:hypothetical protein
MSTTTIAQRPSRAKRSTHSTTDRTAHQPTEDGTSPSPDEPQGATARERVERRLRDAYHQIGVFTDHETVMDDQEPGALLAFAFGQFDPDVVDGMLAGVRDDLGLLRAALQAGGHGITDEEAVAALLRIELRLDVARVVHSRVLRAACEVST